MAYADMIQNARNRAMAAKNAVQTNRMSLMKDMQAARSPQTGTMAAPSVQTGPVRQRIQQMISGTQATSSTQPTILDTFRERMQNFRNTSQNLGINKDPNATRTIAFRGRYGGGGGGALAQKKGYTMGAEEVVKNSITMS